MSLNKTGLVYFHQGWTDIINCLPLISFYKEIYNKLYILVREDAKEIINFYSPDVNKIYVKKSVLDNNIINILKHLKFDYKTMDFLGIGIHDKLRNDAYNNKFIQSSDHFVKRFYTCYNIPYITRINNFEFKRDTDLENKFYQEFVKKHKVYTLIHEDQQRGFVIDKSKIKGTVLNLDKCSVCLFDTIKVLENAKEFHLIDSIWAAFVYLLDSKYKLFRDKKIFIYDTNRGHTKMFTEPVKLDHWVLIENN